MESGYYLDIIILFGFLHLSLSNGEMISLSCNETRTLTSGNYPNNYGYHVDTKWNITAPTYKGIAVVFEDFNTERGNDVLGILDPETHFNNRNYSGQDLSVPPFLSTESSVLVTFESNGLNSYKGFRLALHCYNKSERTSNIRLDNIIEANEGILEVYPDPLNQWLPVCNESFNSNLAEFTCRQLGFPGVSHFGSEVEAQYNKSACVSIVCDNSNFLLQQCTWNVTREDTMKASKLQCLNFAYRGCFPLPTNIATYQRSTDTDVGDCMYTCSSHSSELAAIMWNGCYCLNVSQSVINNETPDNKRCTLEGDPNQETNNWAFHYDVTGSCEHPGDVSNGWWSSNSTYLGSRLTLTCQPGYVINGSKSIECKPNDDANKTDWDKKIPHCQCLPRTTLQTTDASGLQPTKVLKVVVIVIVASSVVFVGILAVIWTRYTKDEQCITVCRKFTKTPSTVGSGPTPSTNDSSIQSTMSNDETKVEQPPPVASTQVSPESPVHNRGEEITSEDDINQVESSVTSPPPEELQANEYATVSNVHQDNQDSSIEAARDLDKCGTRADAVLGGSDTIGISTTPPQQSLCGKSHSMKNRPLPQCPIGGANKPPVPSRKTQTLTRQDQPMDTDTSHSTSRQDFTPLEIKNLPLSLTAARDKTQVRKKAPGGSTPYVKARGKKDRVERKLEEGSLEANTGSRKGSAGDLAPRGVSDVSSSACSIDHCPANGTGSTLGQYKESLCWKGRNGMQNNSNSVSHTSSLHQEQLYSDIDEECQQDKDQASTDMARGAYGSNDAIHPYNTLEPTNTDKNSVVCPEYEDIGNMGATNNGDWNYDHLNFK